ncbi:hypothetical protein Leryth_025157 [Lithospermum erythrorhizon]|nr:hypothetical protein Leryth_025157 [Lithospermum erythrorhizon]
MFEEARDNNAQLLELISNISKLGLFNHFESEVREALDEIAQSISSLKNKGFSQSNDLYTTSLLFNLLRQHGYKVTQDIFLGFVDNKGKFCSSSSSSYSVKVIRELFETSNLGLEDEEILKEARLFSSQYLSHDERNHSLDLPLHWRFDWYTVRRHLNVYECDQYQNANNSSLLKLAKLNFNFVQSVHQQDLKEVTLRWWANLGVSKKLSFARDRMVESFLLATGVAPDPHLGRLRKWLAKVIQLILIVDDVYDIYGSLEELEKFTIAIERWNIKDAQDLPDCMKTCFHILDDTTKEISSEIDKEDSWGWMTTYYLQKAFVDFCKALLIEARWYGKGQTPSLQEYLSNGWVSSSGPLLAVHIIFGVSNGKEQIIQLMESCKDILYHVSLMIRLCNDEGTSAAELARGDAPSSILCYMREENVSEEVARKYIRELMMDAWMNINKHLNTLSPGEEQLVKYLVNIARIGHFMYQHGDGFGVQDRETKHEVLHNLIEPIAIKMS